jgi:hypothetical protein
MGVGYGLSRAGSHCRIQSNLSYTSGYAPITNARTTKRSVSAGWSCAMDCSVSKIMRLSARNGAATGARAPFIADAAAAVPAAAGALAPGRSVMESDGAPGAAGPVQSASPACTVEDTTCARVIAWRSRTARLAAPPSDALPAALACPARLRLSEWQPSRVGGLDRRDAAGSGRPACPPAIPVARSACSAQAAGPSRGSFRWVCKWLQLVLGHSQPSLRLPGPAVGTDRRDAAASGSGRPACPPAIPVARSACSVASLSLSRGSFRCKWLHWQPDSEMVLGHSQPSLPGPAVGTDRRDAAGSGRPA